MDYLEELEALRALGDLMQSDLSRLAAALEERDLISIADLGYEAHLSIVDAHMQIAKWTQVRSQSQPLRIHR